MQGLVHLLLVTGEMIAESQYERQLQNLRGLELDKSEVQPRLVVSALTPVAERRKGQGGQRQCHGNEYHPQLYKLSVVYERYDYRSHDTCRHGKRLCFPVA